MMPSTARLKDRQLSLGEIEWLPPLAGPPILSFRVGRFVPRRVSPHPRDLHARPGSEGAFLLLTAHGCHWSSALRVGHCRPSPHGVAQLGGHPTGRPSGLTTATTLERSRGAGRLEHGPGYRELLIDHRTAVSLPARSDIQGLKPVSRIGGSIVHEHGPDGAGPPPSPVGGGESQAFAWSAMLWEPRPRARSRRDTVPDPLGDGAGLPTRTPRTSPEPHPPGWPGGASCP